jgi:hypothetical protein
MVLFVSFMVSMVQLTLATKSVDGQSNRCMQILNLTFFGTLLVLQIFYCIMFKEVKTSLVIFGVLRSVVELCEKFVVLFLVQQFGSQVTVKTFVHSNGDLIIVGTDSQGHTTFQFTIRSAAARKETCEDIEEIIDTDDWLHQQDLSSNKI